MLAQSVFECKFDHLGLAGLHCLMSCHVSIGLELLLGKIITQGSPRRCERTWRPPETITMPRARWRAFYSKAKVMNTQQHTRRFGYVWRPPDTITMPQARSRVHFTVRPK